jgi:competence protein ComEC
LPQRWRSALRAALRDAVAKRFGDDAPLVHALMLGERGSVAPGFDDVLARTGLVHLLAISGLHVGIVVGAAFALLRGIGLPRPHAALAVAATLPLLHALVVPRPPVARATLMAAVVLLGVASGRRGTALNGLALATVVLTATDPWGTRNFGFQLSSAATAGILLIARVAQQGGRVRRWLCAALAVSAAAQLAVAPLIAAASFRLPLASLPLNLPAVPLTATVLIAAPAALVAAALHCEPLAAAATDVARAALAGLRHLAEAADHRVSAATVPARATPWIGAAALATIGLLASRRPRDAGLRRTGSRHGRGWPEAYGRRGRAVARARAALLLATCLLSAAAGRALTIAHGAPADGFRLIAFDAGQGDALLVETAGARVLIDTSGSPGSDFDPGTALLAPALRARGVDRLDAVVISHLHADHAGGLAGLLAEIDTAAVWTAPFDPAAPAGRAFTAALGDVPLRIALRGSVMALGRDPDGGEAPCGWRALHPAAGFRPPRGRPQSNDESLVLALQCGNRSLLLTGDAEQGAEDAYVPELTLPAGTVLKSPHHGSATSSGSALLTTTATRHVVVSAGWRNRFGLPDAEVLERYRARRIAVYRTDRDGAVTLTAGARTRVRAERWTAGRGHPITGGWLH